MDAIKTLKIAVCPKVGNYSIPAKIFFYGTFLNLTTDEYCSVHFSTNERNVGIYTTVMPQIWLWEQNGHKVGIIGHLGYKTRGFVANEPLEAGMIIRAGICFME